MQHLYQKIFPRQLPWHLVIFLMLFFDATVLGAPIPNDQPNSSKTLEVRVSSTDQQIRKQLLEITPIGTPLEEALKFASAEGKKHGMRTEITVGGAPKQFALAGDYPVLYGFVYNHLFANYLFDSQDRLVDIRAWIGLGATTPAMWLPMDLLLGSCFLIALLLLLVYKRLRIRLLRFYSWIICVSFATWAAIDLIWRASGFTWMPSRPLEDVFVLTYFPVGAVLLVLCFLAANSLIAFSFYLKPSGRKGAAGGILVTLLAVLSDGYFFWWLLFKNQGWT
jgi:hypothetical protein